METGARAGGDSFKTIVPAQVQECANNNDHSSSLGNKSQTPRMWKEVFFVWQMNCFAKLWRSSQNIQCVDDPYSDQNIVFTVKDIMHIGLGKFKDCVITIDGKPMRLLIDLGGKVSILDEAVYRQHFTHHRLQPPTSTLHGYFDSKFEVHRVLAVPVDYKAIHYRCSPFSLQRDGVSWVLIFLTSLGSKSSGSLIKDTGHYW